MQFFCEGLPATKGSMRPTGPRERTVLAPDNRRTKPWQKALAWTALSKGATLHVGKPLSVSLVFFLPRPDGHYSRRARMDQTYDLKPSAPTLPYLRGADVDKLARAVLDGLTGVCWKDDAQVVTLHVSKLYARRAPGVDVTVELARVVERQKREQRETRA